MYIAAIVLVAACDLEGAEPSHATNVSAKALGLGHGEVASSEPPLPSHLDAEVRDLYNELAGRLAARGVTPEEARAAAETGDAEVVRKLFGYTPEKFDEMTARLAALGQSADRDDRGGVGGWDDPIDPGGGEHVSRLRCEWGHVGRYVTWGAWTYARLPEVGLALFAVWGVGCLAENCRLEGGGWTEIP